MSRRGMGEGAAAAAVYLLLLPSLDHALDVAGVVVAILAAGVALRSRARAPHTRLIVQCWLGAGAATLTLAGSSGFGVGAAGCALLTLAGLGAGSSRTHAVLVGAGAIALSFAPVSVAVAGALLLLLAVAAGLQRRWWIPTFGALLGAAAVRAAAWRWMDGADFVAWSTVRPFAAAPSALSSVVRALTVDVALVCGLLGLPQSRRMGLTKGTRVALVASVAAAAASTAWLGGGGRHFALPSLAAPCALGLGALAQQRAEARAVVVGVVAGSIASVLHVDGLRSMALDVSAPWWIAYAPAAELRWLLPAAIVVALALGLGDALSRISGFKARVGWLIACLGAAGLSALLPRFIEAPPWS